MGQGNKMKCDYITEVTLVKETEGNLVTGKPLSWYPRKFR